VSDAKLEKGADRGKGGAAATVRVDHWFAGMRNRTFRVKFVSNYELLTKVTVLSEFSLLKKFAT